MRGLQKVRFNDRQKFFEIIEVLVEKFDMPEPQKAVYTTMLKKFVDSLSDSDIDKMFDSVDKIMNELDPKGIIHKNVFE